MKEIILPKLTHIPDAATHVNRLLELDSFVMQTLFTGKIHREVTMMALIYSFASKLLTKRVAPFTNKDTPDLRPLFSVIISFTTSHSSLMASL